MKRVHGILLVAFALTICGVAVGVTAQEGPDPQAAALGNGVFRSYCASCHGKSAHGDGDVAEFLRVKPADLTLIAERNDGVFDIEMVKKIIAGRENVRGHGRGEMPVWGDAFEVAGGGATPEEVETRIDALANYLWTLQK